jgi:hypothetical protein
MLAHVELQYGYGEAMMRTKIILLLLAVVLVPLLAGCWEFIDPASGVLLDIDEDTGEWYVIGTGIELCGQGTIRGWGSRFVLTHQGSAYDIINNRFVRVRMAILIDLDKGTARGLIVGPGFRTRFNGTGGVVV